MVNENDKEAAEFNMAVSYLNRLNAIFYVCDEASMSLDMYGWFHALMAAYRELSPMMGPEEKRAAEAFRQTIHPKLANTLNLQMRTAKKTIPDDLYNDLHNFDMLTRKVTKDAGLLMRMQEDARKALR